MSKMTVEVQTEDGTSGAWIDVEAETAQAAQELALEKFGVDGAAAGRVFVDIVNTPEAAPVAPKPDSPVDVAGEDLGDEDPDVLDELGDA